MNDVYLKGKIKNIKTGEGQYGKWGFATIIISRKVQGKEYTQFINCMANKYTAAKLETMQDGEWVLAMGSLKNVKNKDGGFEMKVNLRDINLIQFREHPTQRPTEDQKENYHPPVKPNAPAPAYQEAPPITDADLPF